jgi:hypothetical protein
MMTKIEITSGVAAVLFFSLGFLQEVMRGQVHRAKYGYEEISPWDVRYVHGDFGPHGIWKSHKQLCQRSAVRLTFLVICAGLIACIALIICELISR